MNDPLPPSLARRWGGLRWMRQRGPHEWSSECPRCGDLGHDGNDWPDRFRLFSDGKPRAWCRECRYQAFADDDKKNFVVTPEMRRAWLVERQQRELTQLAKAHRALELLRREGSWLRYHTEMDSRGFDFWRSKGVPDWAITYFQLGWCADKTIWLNEHEYHTATATIPVFGVGWTLENLRHRLITPPTPDDKYRPDRAGLPQCLYLTNPDHEPHGETLLVEGEIKSIVVATRLDDPRLCIVGIPGKRIRDDMLGQLKHSDRVHIVLDPDATKQAIDIAKQLGRRARVVTLPVKADDAFTQYGATPELFRAALRYGRVVL